MTFAGPPLEFSTRYPYGNGPYLIFLQGSSFFVSMRDNQAVSVNAGFNWIVDYIYMGSGYFTIGPDRYSYRFDDHGLAGNGPGKSYASAAEWLWMQ